MKLTLCAVLNTAAMMKHERRSVATSGSAYNPIIWFHNIFGMGYGF